MSLALFTGACRSGKSGMAQQWVERVAGPCVYLATADRRDDDAEMAARIAVHQAGRGRRWQSLELYGGPFPLDLSAALARALLLAEPGGGVLVDCITLWLAGLMEDYDDAAIMKQMDAVIGVLSSARPPVALVHNEVGWGLVPENALGRRFRDLSGLCGQRLASVCDTVVLAVCGVPLTVKGRFSLD